MLHRRETSEVCHAQTNYLPYHRWSNVTASPSTPDQLPAPHSSNKSSLCVSFTFHWDDAQRDRRHAPTLV